MQTNIVNRDRIVCMKTISNISFCQIYLELSYLDIYVHDFSIFWYFYKIWLCQNFNIFFWFYICVYICVDIDSRIGEFSVYSKSKIILNEI